MLPAARVEVTHAEIGMRGEWQVLSVMSMNVTSA